MWDLFRIVNYPLNLCYSPDGQVLLDGQDLHFVMRSNRVTQKSSNRLSCFKRYSIIENQSVTAILLIYFVIMRIVHEAGITVQPYNMEQSNQITSSYIYYFRAESILAISNWTITIQHSTNLAVSIHHCLTM